MKPLDILKTANHNLFRSKLRTALTILAIFIGSFTIILTSALNAGVNSFIDEQTEAFGGDDFVMIMPVGSETMTSRLEIGKGPVEFSEKQTAKATMAFTDDEIAQLKQIDGLDADSFFSPQPISGNGYYTSSKTDKRYQIQSTTVVPPGNFSIPLAAGSLPDDNSDELQVVLEPDYPEALGYANNEAILGQTITIGFQNPVTGEYKEFQATVTGVEAPVLTSMSDGAILSHSLYDQIYDFVTANYPPNYESATYYIMASFDTSRFTEDEIKTAIQDAGYTAFTMADIMGMIKTFFDVIMIIFNIFGGIALLAAAIGIVNTLFMSVSERKREIGLMKAFGMSNGKIFALFSCEAIMIGFWGSIIGIAISMIIGYSANAIAHQTFLSTLPTFNLVIFQPLTLLIITIAIMVIAFVAGTAPALRAAREEPIEALRSE